MNNELEKFSPPPAEVNKDQVSPGEQPEAAHELTESEFEQTAEQVAGEVENRPAEVVSAADERIEDVPASVGLDREKGAVIFERGGFAEKIRGIKEKISFLAQTTKKKIKDLFSNQPEVIHFKDLAQSPENPKEPSAQPAESASEALDESTREYLKRKEKFRELQEWAEHEAFSKLGISAEDEEKALAENSSDRKEMVSRSFKNVRETLIEYFNDESLEGRIDWKTRGADLNREQAKTIHAYLQEEFGKRGLADLKPDDFGITAEQMNNGMIAYDVTKAIRKKLEIMEAGIKAKIDEALNTTERYENIDLNNIKTGNELDEAVSKVLEDELKIFAAEQNINQDFISARKTGSPQWLTDIEHRIQELKFEVDVKFGQTVGSEPYTHRRDRDEVLQELQREVKLTSESAFLNVNLAPKALEMMLESGEYKGMFSLDEEKKLAKGTELAGGDLAFYMELRTKIEKALGIYDPEKSVIYGTLGRKNGEDEKFGGASSYGDIFITLKPDLMKRTDFSEGDSLNPMLTTRTVGSKLHGPHSEGKGMTPQEEAMRKQILPENAILAKTVLDLDIRADRKYSAKESAFTYFEAHIKGGIKTDEIERINIPRSKFDQALILKDRRRDDEMYRDEVVSPKLLISLVERLQNDPQWKDKINIIENA